MFQHITYKLTGENRKSFFERIATYYDVDSEGYRLIEKAYDTAKEAFRGVWRDDGDRYFEHLRSVTLILIDMLGVTDYRTICAALLHDIVEDIDGWTIERVEMLFGVEIAMQVAWLTEPQEGLIPHKRERKEFYAGRFSSAPREVLLVKFADRLHNSATVSDSKPEKKRRFLDETRRWYLPVFEAAGAPTHELESVLSQLQATA